MGPWHSPYRDGPNPELVEKFRLRIRTTNMIEILKAAAREMRSVGNAARGVPRWIV